MNLKTRIRSTAMRHFASAQYLDKQRKRARKQREKQGIPATVHYFHQVDDPYSHLAVQKLPQLIERYDVTFEAHLTSKPGADYQGSATHFEQWATQDAQQIAEDYGVRFASPTNPLSEASITDANAALAPRLNSEHFAQTAFEVGEALWSGTPIAPSGNAEAGRHQVAAGNALMHKLGHYQGAMFYFDGEWFWGIDRIRLLEKRLSDEGFDHQSGPACVPEPTPPAFAQPAEHVLLEYFPSLRSPYTAIGHQRVLDLIGRSGVSVSVRPVMPMMMRGIPAPRAKQRYIITDSGREGRACGSPFGRIVDPFGEPVKRAFALFPAAAAAGRSMEFITAYLKAAWFEGIDITTNRGLQQVVVNAGLNWEELQDSTHSDWQQILTDNLAVLNQQSLWGVPSFRVSGGNSATPYACWGQDRIWRVAREIADRTQVSGSG